MPMTNHVPLSPQSLQRQFAELQERASKDALSGLLNRATAEQYINQRLSQMEQEDLCALFIIDLDNFKTVNDTMGHQAGDQAIRLAARVLSGLFRATDIVGRLGGDEFLVFLCGQITEKLVRRKGRELCQKLQLALGSTPAVTVTASVGIYLSGKAQNFEQLYRSADLALYKAKKTASTAFFSSTATACPSPGGMIFSLSAPSPSAAFWSTWTAGWPCLRWETPSVSSMPAPASAGSSGPIPSPMSFPASSRR